jgi:hypothetical protein
MLLLPVLEKEENENGGADELLPLWRKRENISGEGEVWWKGWLSSRR